MVLSLSARAQSAEGRYASRLTQNGNIYFIMPQKIKNLSGLKHFEYDITLLTWTDSATINFTFESPLMLTPENLHLVSGEDSIKCNSYSALYIDIKKKHYEVRITSKFSIADIEKVMNSMIPPIFCFNQGNEHKSASYTLSAWEKDRKKLNDILSLYNYSK